MGRLFGRPFFAPIRPLYWGMRLSILIPVYNEIDYTAEALLSIQNLALLR